MKKVKPFGQEISDECVATAVSARDMLMKQSRKVTPDPLRQSSVLVAMLEHLIVEILLCVGHDHARCALILSHMAMDMERILQEHFDKVKESH